MIANPSSRLQRILELLQAASLGGFTLKDWLILFGKNHPAGTLEKIYTGPRLDMLAHFRVAFRSNYQGNRHPDLPPELKNRMKEIYKPFVTAGLFDSGELS